MKTSFVHSARGLLAGWALGLSACADSDNKTGPGMDASEPIADAGRDGGKDANIAQAGCFIARGEQQEFVARTCRSVDG